MIELLCPRDLALRLGALEVTSPADQRDLKRAGRHMLVRDIETCEPLFWPLAGAGLGWATQRSS